jgi:predicted dehydrogenase
MKKINILIIGFGSIGQRHASILLKKKYTNKIFVYSESKVLPKKFSRLYSLNDINNNNIKYIIISNKTFEHYKILNKINNQFKRKIILVEKPLFNKLKKFSNKNSNKIFVGYNLRFHPGLRFLKNKIKTIKPWYLNIICGSYLPNWRTNKNYQTSYSAYKNEGGGVLLDLSHELDYTTWIFGSLKPKYSIIKKISPLKIKSEDFVKIIGKINKTYTQIELNYFDKMPRRKVRVEGNNFFLEVDLIENSLILIKNKKKTKLHFSLNKNYTYSLQHDDILTKKGKNTCNLTEGLKVLKLINTLKKKRGI